jgi:cytochrome c556
MTATKTIYALSFAAFLAVTGTLAAAPAAAPSPQAAIAARQAGYKKMGAAMKALNDQLKSSTPAKDVMVGAARTIALTAREQGKLFPAGSGPQSGLKTDALPGIWADRANFGGQMARLVAESGKLLTVANGGDAAAIRAQVKATGATCSSCHRQFRADS